MCLLIDCYCFCEVELIKFEIVNKDLVVCFLGFVFKEVILKKIKLEYEYYYFYKIFQEYLVVLYLVNLLLRELINIFEYFYLDFCGMVSKYCQVFFFVVGVLDKEVSILFI